MRSRFTRKPGQSRTTIGVLSSASASRPAARTVWALVRSPGMISTSGMRLGGLKKCMPTKRSGCRSAPDIPEIESEEVLLAMTASSESRLSTSASTFFFTSRFSTTASTTKSGRPSAA